MAHNLVYNSITKKHEFMSRGATWHELGQVVENATTWEETVTLAGLDWEVEKRALLTPQGQPIPRLYGVFRKDKTNDLDGYLGNVGENFTPIQTKQAFQFVDALMEMDGGAHYESAGALGKGEKVFCLANIGAGFEVVDGDHHESYLLFLNTFNSDQSSRCMVTTVRVVCANTLSMALRSDDAKTSLTFRRTQNVPERMMAAQQMLQSGKVTAESLREKLQILAGRELTAKYREAVVDALFPPPPETAGKTATSKRQVRVDAFLSLFEQNDNERGIKSIEGTAYNALNAFTEYVDFEIPVVRTAVKDGLTDSQIRASRALLDDGATDKANALDSILAVTVGAPLRSQSKLYGGSASPFQTIDTLPDTAYDTTVESAAAAIDAGQTDSIFDDDIIDD